MKKEQINWLREEPVELQDITIKEFKPFPVETTDLDLDDEIADTIHYLARINVLGKEIERLNNTINELYNGLEEIIDQGYDYNEKDCIAIKLQNRIKELKGEDKE